MVPLAFGGFMSPCTRLALAGAFVLLLAPSSFAQDPSCPCPAPPQPPPVWTGSASAGLGLTAGNSDTRNVNLAFEATRDPKTRNVLKLSALYLWSEQDGEASANRLSFLVRDEYKLSARAFVFGQLMYLRDPFKEIDYLVAPTGGLGYKLINSDRTTFSVDAGAGGSWEKNPGLDVTFSGAVTAGEQFSHKLSATASLTQSVSALWKMDDFGDALYTFGAGVSATLTARTSIKIELLDTYKTEPPTDDVKKNDVALLASLVYKF
jgi:putative salt-induced outer membrane protein